MFPGIEEDARPGQEDKCRSAEMRDPSRKEHFCGWPSCRNPGKDAHMIDRHQDHHRAANEIDGRDAGFRRGRNGERSGSKGSTHDFAPGRGEHSSDRSPAGQSPSLRRPRAKKVPLNAGCSRTFFAPQAFDGDTISRTLKRPPRPFPETRRLPELKPEHEPGNTVLRVLESMHIQCFLISKTC